MRRARHARRRPVRDREGEDRDLGAGAGAGAARLRPDQVNPLRPAAAVLVLALAGACVPTLGRTSQATPSASPKQLKAIVHAWSNRLNAGDNDGAARLFRLPAIVVQSEAYRFQTRKQLARWHSLL